MSMHKVERRTFVGLAIASMFALGNGRDGYAQSTVAPAMSIERLNEAVLTVMKAGRSVAFSRRFAIMATAIDETFDLDTILQRSVGARWPMLPADEQTLLRTTFRRYTIVNYVANFDSYDGETFAVAPETQAVPGGDVVVTTQILAATGLQTTLSYVVRQGSGWKVIDVLANGGISRVAVQRSDFRSSLNQGGGLALIASLRHKVLDLSGGALS